MKKLGLMRVIVWHSIFKGSILTVLSLQSQIVH